MEQAYLRGIYRRLTGAILMTVLTALAAIAWFSQQAFEQVLVPEMQLKAHTVGMSEIALIAKATAYGVPYRDLYGVAESFAELRRENPDFSYLAATDGDGNILWESGARPDGMQAHAASRAVLRSLVQPDAHPAPALLDGSYVVSLAIAPEGRPLGVLHIGMAQKFIQNIMLEVLLDLVVVLIVALFFTFELLNFLAGAPLAAGLRDLAATIARVKGGDYTHSGGARARDEIGRILGHVDAAIARLNESCAALDAEVQAALRRAAAPAHERVRAAWEALQANYRFGAAAAAPGADANAVERIRAPLFTFILAEELSRAFLPAYVNQLIVAVPGVSPQIVVGLPIVLFMLIVAIGQPFLGAWSERAGRRRAMLVGAVIGMAGYAATALAHNLLDLLAWRSICAVGYAIVFVAAQGWILDHARPAQRAQGFALFIGAIMVATICGPPIGGILADNIGNRMTFGVSAALCALSIFAIRTLPGAVPLAAHRAERAPGLADFARLLTNARFMTLTGLAAMPAKIILTGFCFYLIPLYIVSIGGTQAMAGRMLMVYAVMMVLIVPVAARFADRGIGRDGLVALGLCVSGIGGLLLMASGSFYAVFAVVLFLGLGQALSIAAQSTLVGDLCRNEIERFGDGAVYGVYRMLERLGNALGPLLAGLLVVSYGYQGAFVAISALVLGCGTLFAIFVTLIRRAPPAANARV